MQLRDKWIATISVLLLAATLGTAQSPSSVTTNDVVPRLVKFSGSMKDDAGPAETGIKGVTFALYKDQYGGAPLWLETQNVRVDSKGNYSALLGSTKPEGLPADLFSSNEARWLGVRVEGQAEQPRVVFVSVPYALKAADAETIGGLPPSAFVRANPATALTGSSESQAASVAATGSKNALPATLNVITPPPGQPAGFVPLWTGASPTHTLGSSVLFETSKKIGLNTKTPGASLEIDSTNQLGLFLHAPFSGNVGTGLDFFTTGSGGRQWEILATGSAAAQGPGKLNIRDITSGKDIFTISSLDDTVGIGTTNPGGAALTAVSNNANSAVLGQNKTSDGNGVQGETTGIVDFNSGVIGVAQASTGVTYGVNGVNNSTNFFAAGVEGDSFATSGKTLGTVGTAASPTGTGVWGLSVAPSQTGNGLIGCCAVGVWGDTSSSGSGAAGVVGTADDGQAIGAFNNGTTHLTANIQNFENSTHNVAVLFAAGAFGSCTSDTDGNLNCTGHINQLVPAAHGQRQVAVYSVGSPQSWFEDFGSSRLAGGSATVALEPTFAQTVNTSSDYHVFLTPEGDCRGLYVSNKTASGFEVHELGGGQSNVSFSYRIVALRLGYENVRLEDKTEMMAKLKAETPKPSAAPRPEFKRRTRLAIPDGSAASTQPDWRCTHVTCAGVAASAHPIGR